MLRWPRPQLVDPVTLELGTGHDNLNLDTGRDYIIRFPSTLKTGRTILHGGRNILIIGGHLTVAPGLPATAVRAAIAVYGATGTVHIEGVLINNPFGSEFDGIVFKAPEAILQLQNIRIDGLTGSFIDPGRGGDGYHADIIQNQGGARELRIYRMTASGDYQGMFLTDGSPSRGIGHIQMYEVDLTFRSDKPDQTRGYLLWLTDTEGGFDTSRDHSPTTLSRVHLIPHPGRDIDGYVWPNSLHRTAPPVIQGGQVSWPALSRINGVVNVGPPTEGEFVPQSLPGIGYDQAGSLVEEPAEPPVPEPGPAGSAPSGEPSSREWQFAPTQSFSSPLQADGQVLDDLPETQISVSVRARIQENVNWNMLAHHEWTGGWALYTDSEGRAHFGVGDHNYVSSAAGVIVPGGLYDIVGEYDGAEMRLYVDGQLLDQRPMSGIRFNRVGSVYFGPIHGQLSEVRLGGSASGEAPAPSSPPASSAPSDPPEASPSLPSDGEPIGEWSFAGTQSFASAVRADGPTSEGQITVSALVRIDENRNWNMLAQQQWVGGWALFTDSDGRAQFGIGNHQYASSPPGALVPGSHVYHVVGVYDGGEMRLYLDGALVGRRTLAGVRLQSGGSVYFGPMEGQLSEVQIYAYALDQPSPNASSPSPIHSWSFPAQEWDMPAVLDVRHLPTDGLTIFSRLTVERTMALNAIVNHRFHTQANGWALYLDEHGRLCFGIGGTLLVGPAQSVTEGSHEVVGTYDGSEMSLYVDGVRIAHTPAESMVLESGGALSVGSIAGAIHELRIYDRSLAIDELD